MAARIVQLLVLVLAVGCASQRGSGRFPTQAELDQIAAPPEARSLALAERKDVSAWVLEGPLPEGDAQSVTNQPSPFSQELELASVGRMAPMIRTRAMACAARELGRFFLEHGGQPSEGLQRFILSLCGSATPRISTAYLYGAVPDGAPSERVISDWRMQVRVMITSLFQRGENNRAGLWFGRAKGQAVVMAVTGESRAEFSALRRTPDAEGRVRIEGRLTRDADSISALVNHGRFGVEDCEEDPGIALPRFALSCSVERSDAHAWISISAFPPGRVLGDRVLNLLVWPNGVRSKRYARPARPSSERVATPEELPAAILRVLNTVRREARLSALELAPEQSETARRLAPIYLLAMMGEEPPETADKVALGMMAGWEVPGILRHGRVASAFSAQTRDVGDLLASALEDPSGRFTLLDPKARAIAIGPVSQAKGELTLLGALIGTYAFFDDDEDPARSAEIAYQKLAETARARGVAEIALSEDLTYVASEAARAIREGEWSPRRALDNALSVAANQRPGIPITGLYVEASDLDQIAFQDDFFEAGSMQIGLAVTHYKPSDWPWGRYIVLVVAAGERPLITASLRPGAGWKGAGLGE